MTICELYRTAINYTKHFLFQGPPSFTQNGIFYLKINPLATLPTLARLYVDTPKKNEVEIWYRCYDFKNIFAQKIGEKIGVFDSKQS
jgi:hypothetical protein